MARQTHFVVLLLAVLHGFLILKDSEDRYERLFHRIVPQVNLEDLEYNKSSALYLSTSRTYPVFRIAEEFSHLLFLNLSGRFEVKSPRRTEGLL